MPISILNTDGSLLPNDGSNGISILGPDGALMPNNGSNGILIYRTDGALRMPSDAEQTKSILDDKGALKPYEEGNTYSILGVDGAYYVPAIQRINLLENTRDFSQSYWTKLRVTATNLGEGVFRLADNSVNNEHVLYADQIGSFNENDILICIIEVMLESNFGLTIRIGPTSNIVNPNRVTLKADGTWTAQDNTRASVTQLSDGWYRIATMSTKNSTGVGVSPAFNICQADGTIAYAGDGSGTVLVRNPQLLLATDIDNVPNKRYQWVDSPTSFDHNFP